MTRAPAAGMLDSSRRFCSDEDAMSSKTNVLCGFDDAYAPHFATMISSLFAASQNPERIQVHLVSNLISHAVRTRLDQIFARYRSGEIQWLEVDCSPFVNAPVTLHFTRAMYSRIAAFNVLRTERVLYLDADLLCLADVADLYDWNLEGKAVGAVLDPYHTFGVNDDKVALGLPKEALCFNSDVRWQIFCDRRLTQSVRDRRSHAERVIEQATRAIFLPACPRLGRF